MPKTLDQPQTTLYQRLAEIAATLTVDKNGHMTEGGKYDYIKHTDLISALKPILKENGIAIIPLRSEVIEASEYKTGSGKLGRHIRLKVTYRVVDIWTGEGFEIEGPGESADTGDKGTQKAVTSAEKYLYMRLFKVVEDAHDTDGILAPEGVKDGNDSPRPAAGSQPIPHGNSANEAELDRLRVLSKSMEKPWAEPILKARLERFGFAETVKAMQEAGATGEITATIPPPPPPPSPVSVAESQAA